MNKEFWNKLPSEEKTKAIRHFLKSQELVDFDYDKVKAQYEKITSELGDKAWCYFCQLENPMLELSAIDPVLSYLVYSLLFTKHKYNVEGKEVEDTIPILGFRVDTIFQNKAAVMNLSDSEKQVLAEAIRIIQDKL